MSDDVAEGLEIARLILNKDQNVPSPTTVGGRHSLETEVNIDVLEADESDSENQQNNQEKEGRNSVKTSTNHRTSIRWSVQDLEESDLTFRE